jgi:hypothetical protein
MDRPKRMETIGLRPNRKRLMEGNSEINSSASYAVLSEAGSHLQTPPSHLQEELLITAFGQ